MDNQASPTFNELLQSSVIVSGILAIMAFATVCYVIVAHVPVEPYMQAFLTVIVSAVIGIFFGQRGVNSNQRIADSAAATNAQLAADFANNVRLILAQHDAQLANVVKQAAQTPPAGGSSGNSQ